VGFGSAITNCPSICNFSYCGTVQYDFNAQDPEGDPIHYLLDAGPGEINPNTGLWTFALGPGNENDTFVLWVIPYEYYCGDTEYALYGQGCEVEIRINGGPPENYPDFASPQPYKFIAISGETLSVQLQVADPDSVNSHQFSWYTSPQDPTPGWASIDPNTGEFKYYGETDDTALYWILNSVSECGEGDTMGFYIYHFENFLCGDLNHDGAISNILDLTWIVDYTFRGGPTPAPKEAGNVNCSPGVNITDLTYIVDRVFRGGPPPCAACPK
jgi:hypothetical protein